MEKLLSVRDLSELLSVKQSTVYYWVHRNTIPYLKIGRCVRFDLEQIKEWLKQKEHATVDEEEWIGGT